MPDRYFDKFPIISYANNAVVNITERATFVNNLLQNPYLYYDYQVAEGERPDQLSDRYYNDQYKSWIWYLTNQMKDPYYDWYMSDDVFYGYLEAKYKTSIYTLQQRTKYYINNWFQDERKLSVSDYNAMSNTLHKFWQPFYQGSPSIAGYERVQSNTVINTNQIVIYSAIGTNFIEDEVVNIVFDTNDTGKGQVLVSNSSSVTLKHMVNTVVPNNTVTITGSSYLYGVDSQTNVAFTSANVVTTNIPLEEVVYYTPLSIYDYERDINESKKTIKVLNSTYTSQLVTELKSLLK